MNKQELVLSGAEIVTKMLQVRDNQDLVPSARKLIIKAYFKELSKIKKRLEEIENAEG